MADNQETLLIKIGADIVDLKKATAEAATLLRGMDKSTQDAAKGMTSALQGIATAFRTLVPAASASALAGFTLQAVRAVADLGRLADQAGVTATEFQRLSFALRDAQVPNDQLAQTLALFSRNLADLQRNTGPFLQFLRESSPELIAQFRAVQGTSAALGVLSDATASFNNRQDRLRLLVAAGGDQMGKFAGQLSQGRLALDDASKGFTGLSNEAIKRANEIRREYDDLTRFLTERWQKFAVDTTSFFAQSRQTFQQLMAGLRGGREMMELQRYIDTVRAAEEESARLFNQMSMRRRDPESPDVMRQQMAEAQNALMALQGLAVNFGTVFTGNFGIMREGFTAWTNELTQFHTPAFEQAYARMNAAMKRSGAVQGEILAMKRGLHKQEQQLILDTATQAATTLTQVFQGNKLAAIGAAVINTAVAVTKALQLPWPFNWIQAALVAASGAAQIASIRSANEKGGGSVAGVGASGGTAGPAASEAESGRTLTIQGIDPGAFYSGRMMDQLIENINREVSDGATLITTRDIR